MPASAKTTPQASWHDRAMNAPVSVAVATKMPSPLSIEALEEATQALGGIFEQLIDEATTMSALKSQQHAAKKRAERRLTEYEKSKHHHDKFPSIKEAQTASKVDMESELQTISDKVNEKRSLLESFAIKAAEKLIPTLLARGGRDTTDQEHLLQRVEGLEKTCKGFEKLVEDQRTLLEQQRKANRDLEEKHQALTKTVEEKHEALTHIFRTVQGQSSSTQKRLESDMVKVDEMLQKVRDSEQAIESLKTDISTIKGDYAKVSAHTAQYASSLDEVLQEVKGYEQAIGSLKTDFSKAKGDAAKVSVDNAQLSSDIKAQDQKMEALNSRVKDIDAIRTELRSLQSVSTATDTEEFKRLKDQSSSLVSYITDLAKAQNQFHETLTELQGRVNDMAKRPDTSIFENRLQKLEKPHDTRDSVTKKDLEALRDRVQQIERKPPPPHSLPTKHGSTSPFSRVEALEKVELSPRVEALEKDANSRTIIVGNLEQRLKGVEVELSSLCSDEIATLKKQIAALETQRRHDLAVSPVTLNPQLSSSVVDPQPEMNEISAQIQTMEKKFQEIKEAQEVHDETWTDVLNERIEEETQKLQVRISSLEAKSSELEIQPQSSFDNATIVSETTSKVVAIFTANPELLPFSRLSYQRLDDTQKANIVNEAATDFIATIAAKPDLLPYPSVDRTTYIVGQTLNQALLPIHTLIEATNLSLGNLQSRVDNINTLDLSRHALGQLYELHPDLGKIEVTLLGFKTDLAGYKTDLQGLHGAIQTLGAKAQDQPTTGAITQVTQQYHELRKEVDSLTEDGINISRKVKALGTEVENALRGVSDLQSENELNKEEVATQIAKYTGELEGKIDKLRAPRPPPVVPQRSSNTTGVVRGPGPRPSSTSSAGNRQPSVSSVTSNSTKKRKLDNALATKTNGVRPRSSSGSPQAKRRQRKAFGEDDPEADPDYNEDIQEPGVSDDE